MERLLVKRKWLCRGLTAWAGVQPWKDAEENTARCQKLSQGTSWCCRLKKYCRSNPALLQISAFFKKKKMDVVVTPVVQCRCRRERPGPNSHHDLTDIWRGESGFDIRGTRLTFGAECLRGELQSLDVLRSDIFQADGHLLGLTVEKLNGHRAGQLFFGQRLRRVGWPAQVGEEDKVLINWLEWAQVSFPCELYTSEPF